MNSRYIYAPNSLCISGNGVNFSSFSQTGEERFIAANSRSRPYPNSPPSFLIRLAMKVSRARWYTFLRRVFHYQNGSGSNLGPNPFNSGQWMLMECIVLALQVIASAYTLFISKGERPVWPMRIWISGYAFGCFLNLILLHWRYKHVYITHENNISNASDIELQRNHEELRLLKYMNKCRTSLELIFAIWFVMGNVWIFDSRFGSYNRAPKLHILCISLLVWNAVSYSFPFILFVLLCCCVPLLSGLLGYNMNSANHERGATEEQLASLSSWKYKDVCRNFELGTKNNEIQECCICLAKYKEKEEIRQLPCTHIFHLECVDQWLKILSCCPLCKQGIEK